MFGSECVGAIASCGQGRGRRALAAGARVVSPAVLQPPGAGRQGSASGSFRGGSRLPLATASVAGRGSAARKKMLLRKKVLAWVTDAQKFRSFPNASLSGRRKRLRKGDAGAREGGRRAAPAPGYLAAFASSPEQCLLEGASSVASRAPSCFFGFFF